MSEISPTSPIARGQALVVEGRLEEALAVFEAALVAKPHNPEAAFYVGDTLSRLGRPDHALPFVNRAVATEPTNADLRNYRGKMLLDCERYDEAIADYDASLRLRPGAFEAVANRALALTRLHRFDEALRGYADASAIAPNSPELQWNDAILRLQLGDFANAWENFEARWKLAHTQHSLRNFPEPLWTGPEDISGKRILLYAEQGFGDTFQFARYAPLVAARDATVFIEVQPAVVALVRNSIPAEAVIAGGNPLPAVDFQCPLLSLPRAFRTRLDTIPTPTPYIHARTDKVLRWSRELPSSPAPRVGLVWSGASHHALDKKRSIPLGRLLAAIPPGMERVILQREISDDDSRLIANNAAIRPSAGALQSGTYPARDRPIV
jgi:Flp pilus assembly protein TadD